MSSDLTRDVEQILTSHVWTSIPPQARVDALDTRRGLERLTGQFPSEYGCFESPVVSVAKQNGGPWVSLVTKWTGLDTDGPRHTNLFKAITEYAKGVDPNVRILKPAQFKQVPRLIVYPRQTRPTDPPTSHYAVQPAYRGVLLTTIDARNMQFAMQYRKADVISAAIANSFCQGLMALR